MKHCDSKWHFFGIPFSRSPVGGGMKSPKLTSFCLKILDLRLLVADGKSSKDILPNDGDELPW